jgi:hypothetical protein
MLVSSLFYNYRSPWAELLFAKGAEDSEAADVTNVEKAILRFRSPFWLEILSFLEKRVWFDTLGGSEAF